MLINNKQGFIRNYLVNWIIAKGNKWNDEKKKNQKSKSGWGGRCEIKKNDVKYMKEEKQRIELRKKWKKKWSKKKKKEKKGNSEKWKKWI